MGVTEEHSLPTETSIHTELLFRIDSLLHRAMDRVVERINVSMVNARGPARGPRDYAPTRQELEEMIANALRDNEPGIRIVNSKGNGGNQWQNKLILGVCTILVASAIMTTATVIVTVASIRTRVEDYIKSNDERLSRVEKQADETQRRLDRGAAAP